MTFGPWRRQKDGLVEKISYKPQVMKFHEGSQHTDTMLGTILTIFYSFIKEVKTQNFHWETQNTANGPQAS